MPLTPERMAQLDAWHASQGSSPDFLTQIVPDAPKGLTPERMAELDAWHASQSSPKQPQVGVAEDVAKSVGSGLAQGALGVPFGIADLGNSLVAGPQQLGRGLYPHIMKAGKSIGFIPQDVPERTQEELNAEPMWQPFYGSGDATKALGIDYEPKTAAGMAAAIPSQMMGAVVTGKAINNIATARPIPTSEQLRDTGSDLFQKAEKSGGVLWSKVTDDWVDEAKKILPQTQAGKTILGETPATKLVERMDQLKGQPMSLQAAMEIDSALGDMAATHVDHKTGKLLAEGTKIKGIQQSLRNKIENAGPADILNKSAFDTWKEARNHWAASYRMNDVERIIAKAQMSDNPVTVMRNGFKNMVTNKANLYGYSKEEIRAMQHAARTGIVTGALKTAGSKIISGFAGGAGGAIGGGFPGAMAGAVAGEAVGYPMRSLANKLQANRAKNVQKVIAKRVKP